MEGKKSYNKDFSYQKNQNSTLSLVYGVFSVIEAPEGFLTYDLCFAFVNVFWQF